MHEEGEKEEI